MPIPWTLFWNRLTHSLVVAYKASQWVTILSTHSNLDQSKDSQTFHICYREGEEWNGRKTERGRKRRGKNSISYSDHLIQIKFPYLGQSLSQKILKCFQIKIWTIIVGVTLCFSSQPVQCYQNLSKNSIKQKDQSIYSN